ncbi:MAG: Asp-tRNA(Asn)/Glu-tRNA(Gln) amidotransferase subunit GatC [Planctomycetota bacterium]
MDSHILEQITQLARIELDDSERDRLAAQLGAILEHFQELQKLDTEGIEPSVAAVDMPGRKRADMPLAERPERSLMSNTSHHQDRLYRVPRVME